MSKQPNRENSRYKLWIALKSGQKINMFSFPKEDKKAQNYVFAGMFKRLLVERYSGQYEHAVFYDVRANSAIYKVDSFGNVKRA